MLWGGGRVLKLGVGGAVAPVKDRAMQALARVISCLLQSLPFLDVIKNPSTMKLIDWMIHISLYCMDQPRFDMVKCAYCNTPRHYYSFFPICLSPRPALQTFDPQLAEEKPTKNTHHIPALALRSIEW